MCHIYYCHCYFVRSSFRRHFGSETHGAPTERDAIGARGYKHIAPPERRIAQHSDGPICAVSIDVLVVK